MSTKLFWFLGHWLDPKGQISPEIPIGHLFHCQEANSSSVHFTFKVWTGRHKAEGILRSWALFMASHPTSSASISLSLPLKKPIKSIAPKSTLNIFLDSHSRYNVFSQNSFPGPVWVGQVAGGFCRWAPQRGPQNSSLSPAPGQIWSSFSPWHFHSNPRVLMTSDHRLPLAFVLPLSLSSFITAF